MKTTGSLIIPFLFITTCLSAQKSNTYIVTAGMKTEACIPFLESYRYPEFTVGKVMFNNGTTVAAKLNYSFLFGEMQYLQLKDTLSIANVKDIRLIAIAQDTFYFDNGYLELIHGSPVKVAVKEYFKQMEVIKKDSYGSAGSNSATDSYNTLQTAGQTYKLIINQDRIFKKIAEYYLVASSGEYVPFTKKKVFQLFPLKKNAIDAYLKSDKVDFDSREDLIRFAEYLSGL